MHSIISIKDIFNNIDILDVYSDCMYMPNREKLINRAIEYMNNELIYIFGCYEDSKIVGVIVIELLYNKTAEIKGIAVDNEYRNEV